MDELQPVEDGEFVYRRIHPKFYKAAAPVSILYEAFRPSRSDDAGLSVIRARFAQPEDDFRNAVTQRAVVIDIGEAEVLERQVAHAVQGRIDVGGAAADVFE